MSQIGDFRAKAQHNLDFADHIKDSGYFDWEVVAIFYACLHRVKATLSYSGLHLTGDENHQQIVQAVKDVLGKAVSYDYTDLLMLSYNARYKVDIQMTAEDRDSAQTYFAAVERACKNRDTNIAREIAGL